MNMKRVLAMLVAFLMVFSMLPASVLADGEGTYTVTRTIMITGPGTVKSMLGGDEQTFVHTGEGTAAYTHTVQVQAKKTCAYQLEAVSDEVYGFDAWYKDGERYYSLPVLPLGQPSYVMGQEAGSTYYIDTYEAKFVARTYSVRIHFEAEEGGSVDPTLYTKDNIPAATWESFSSKAIPDEHYDFAGWYYNGELYSEDETMTDSVNSTYVYGYIERTYTAKFTPALYEIVFMIVTENEGTHYLSRKSYPYGTPASEIKVPTGPEMEGYAFLCWREGTAEDAPLIHDVTGTAVYYPHYTKNFYTVGLTFDTEGDGTVSLGSFSKNVPLGEEISVSSTAQASEDSRFVGWYKNGSLYTTDETLTVNYTSSTLNEAFTETYTAVFEAIEYNATVNGGSGSGSYVKGADVKIKADAPEEGKRFKEWEGADELVFTSGSAQSAEATFTMPAKEVSLTAVYEEIPPSYTLTVNSGTGSGEYEAGSEVSIKANSPVDGKRFKEWEGADELVFTSGSAQSGEATFKMPSQDLTLTATYEDAVYTWSSLKADLEAGKSVKLFNDVTRDAAEYISIQDSVTLDLNGHAIYGYEEGGNIYNAYNLIKVEDNGILTVTDSSEEKSGKLANVWGTDIIDITGTDDSSCGSLILEAGTIGDASGAVRVIGYGHFTMTGGEINTVGAGGVSLYDNASFDMQGGSITGNDEGVCVYSGSVSFTVSGDVDITGNESTDVDLYFIMATSVDDPASFNPIHIGGELADTAKIGVYTDRDINVFNEKALPFTEGLKGNGGKENFLLNGRDDIRIGTSKDGELVLSAPRMLTVGNNMTASFRGLDYSEGAVIEGPVTGDEIALYYTGEIPEGSTVRYKALSTGNGQAAGTVSYPGAGSSDGKYAVLIMPDCDVDMTAELSGGYTIPDGVTLEESFSEDGSSSMTAVIDSSSDETVSIPGEIDVDEVIIEGNFTVGQAVTLMLPFSTTYSGKEQTGAVLYTFSGVVYDETEQKWVATLAEVEEGTSLTANTPYVAIPLKTTLTFGNLSALNTTGGGNQEATVGDWAVQGVYEQTDMTGDESGYGFVASSDGDADPVVDPLGCYLAYVSTETGTELPETIEVRIGSSSGESVGQFVRFAKENTSTDPTDPNGNGNGNGSGDTGSGNGSGSGNTGTGSGSDSGNGAGSANAGAGTDDDKDKETGTQVAVTSSGPEAGSDTQSAEGQEILTTGVDTNAAKKPRTLLWVGLAALVILIAGGWYLLKNKKEQ